ncbi:MAG: helix-turn-helix transcriptional regulator [Anaerolineales bacterium]|nr:helix-turn-helix transcriptional regulator [Anaerolineales bacterium]
MDDRNDNRGRGGGCRKRVLRRVRMLEPILLLLLHHGPSHGYTLSEKLEEFGLDEMNPSMIYRALRDMEENAWISSTWDAEQAQGPPRRVYHLTASGDEVLNRYTHELIKTKESIDYFLDSYTHHMEYGVGEHHPDS